jgi:hypothetical protein
VPGASPAVVGSTGDPLYSLGTIRPPPRGRRVRAVCQAVAMRLHISMADELVAQLDRRVGRRRRSAFIAATVRQALDDERRWDQIEASIGALAGTEHEWDADPEAWVAAQRRGDERRIG